MKLNECTLIEAFMCKHTESVIEVAKKLREHTLRHIFVVDEEDKPIGLISTTDMNNRIVAEGKDPSTLVATDVMTQPIEAYEADQECSTVYKEMVKNKRIMCAVVENGKMSGMITVNELFSKIAHGE